MLLDLYVNYGTPALTWVLVALGGLLARLVIARIGAGKVADAIGRAWYEIQMAVLEVNQTYVDDIKASREDGTLTDGEKKAALDKAIAVAKSNLGTKGLARLARVLGIDIDSWFKSKTEAAVKLSQASATAVIMPGPTATPALAVSGASPRRPS